jgi:hypothetical protein
VQTLQLCVGRNPRQCTELAKRPVGNKVIPTAGGFIITWSLRYEYFERSANVEFI